MTTARETFPYGAPPKGHRICELTGANRPEDKISDLIAQLNNEGLHLVIMNEKAFKQSWASVKIHHPIKWAKGLRK